jgi:hypothetical protein
MEWITELSAYLSQSHTSAEVKHILMTNLKQWLEPSTILDDNIATFLETCSTDLNQAYHQQQTIEWRHFIRGRLTIEWGKIISGHLINAKLHNITAEKWATDLIYINWKHILKIWR